MRHLVMFAITERCNIRMKRLTEGAHQTSDDLTVANTAYSWHASM